MKKRNFLAGLMSVACASAMLFSAGCSLNDDQQVVVANNAGMMTVVSWVAFDNPTADEMLVAYEYVSLIEDAVTAVEGNGTYLEAIYPIVERQVQTSELEDQYKPLVLASSVTILNGLDLFVVANPEWVEDQEDAIRLAKAFLTGARTGLSMSPNDPVIRTARSGHATRAKIYQP